MGPKEAHVEDPVLDDDGGDVVSAEEAVVHPHCHVVLALAGVGVIEEGVLLCHIQPWTFSKVPLICQV